MDERGLDIEKTKNRVLYGKRIYDEITANHRGVQMAALGRGQIRESEQRPLTHANTLRLSLAYVATVSSKGIGEMVPAVGA